MCGKEMGERVDFYRRKWGIKRVLKNEGDKRKFKKNEGDKKDLKKKDKKRDIKFWKKKR